MAKNQLEIFYWQAMRRKTLRAKVLSVCIYLGQVGRLRVCAAAATLCLALIVWRLATAGGNVNGIDVRRGATYVFVFSTGRCGTQHLARTLAGGSGAYVTHEEEHATMRARDVVARVYRGWEQLDEVSYNATALRYLAEEKEAYWGWLLAHHRARHLVYTGHLPTAWGLAPHIAARLGARVRFVRLRRGRLATAASLMALGPASQDPWGVDAQRWFAGPRAPWARLSVTRAVWAGLNRYQRWLWYVDDVECRWQALKLELSASQVYETSLEALEIMDGGHGWRELASFAGVKHVPERRRERHNSIQSKQRVKQDDEALLREWDEQYKTVVGKCKLDSTNVISW